MFSLEAAEENPSWSFLASGGFLETSGTSWLTTTQSQSLLLFSCGVLPVRRCLGTAAFSEGHQPYWIRASPYSRMTSSSLTTPATTLSPKEVVFGGPGVWDFSMSFFGRWEGASFSPHHLSCPLPRGASRPLTGTCTDGRNWPSVYRAQLLEFFLSCFPPADIYQEINVFQERCQVLGAQQ